MGSCIAYSWVRTQESAAASNALTDLREISRREGHALTEESFRRWLHTETLLILLSTRSSGSGTTTWSCG